MRTLLRSGLLAVACAASASALSAQTPPSSPVDSAVVAAPAPAPAPARTAGPRSTSTRLVAADIQHEAYSNVYDLVRARRPRWLRVRIVGALGQQEVVMTVIDNGMPMPVTELRNISPAHVEKLEFRDSFDATGSGSAQYTYAGTIYVTMKR